MPFSSTSIQRFKAVWPPIVGKTASIFRSFKISTIEAGVKGFK